MKDIHELETTEMLLPEFMDGPIAAPENHRVIFENDRVRVVEFKVKPGHTVPVHTHKWPTVNYVVAASDFRSYDAEGNLKLDTRFQETEVKDGEVFCLAPYPPLHSVENVGSSEMLGVSVELKD